MPRRRSHLRLIGSDPAEIFNDLDQLRQDQRAPPRRRPRSAETFARIPHDKALQLYRQKISPAGWLVLIELDRTIPKARGRNPVLLWSPRLRAAGLNSQSRMRALLQLERAGHISVERRGRGLSPWVTHNWFERRT
jgi:hypothetical protein